MPTWNHAPAIRIPKAAIAAATVEAAVDAAVAIATSRRRLGIRGNRPRRDSHTALGRVTLPVRELFRRWYAPLFNAESAS